MTAPDLTPAPVDPEWLPAGTQVGAYVVRRALGHGTGQIAYLAEGPRKRLVVLKMSLFPKGERGSESRTMHQRFLRQVAFFLELDGVPGIARVSAYGMYPDTSRDGHLYMVQEWVPRRRTIVDWCRQEPRPLNIIVCGWVMLAAACGEMARRGICHRDLTAANVLMTPRGVPKVVDFNSGIGQGSERLTWPSARCVPGDPASYSPEHCEALLLEYATRRPIPFQHRPAGDLHALGVIFYEVLTGRHPFRHARGEALHERIAHQMPERPRVLNPEVPFGLEKVTMKLLQKSPEQRYQSGDQLALDLEALFATGEDWSRPFLTPPRSRPASPPRTARRPPTSRARLHLPTVVDAVASGPPSAIVRAGPKLILVRDPRALAGPPAPPRRSLRAPVRLALLAVAAASVLLGRHAIPDDDQSWLQQCSPEARTTALALGLLPSAFTPEPGAGAGPVEVRASLTAVPGGFAARLFGELRTGSDGPSFRFTRLRLDDGRELPICAAASARGGGGALRLDFAR